LDTVSAAVPSTSSPVASRSSAITCAHRRKLKLLKTFLFCFGKVRLYFITISFQGVLRFDGSSDSTPDLYWDACVNAVKQMVEGGIFQGAIWCEEIHVASLLPPRVFPHFHLIVAADDVERRRSGLSRPGSVSPWRNRPKQPPKSPLFSTISQYRVDRGRRWLRQGGHLARCPALYLLVQPPGPPQHPILHLHDIRLER
jgi:hypothetical protein